MHLIHVLLPLADNAGKPLPRGLVRRAAAALAETCGGMPAPPPASSSRSPSPCAANPGKPLPRALFRTVAEELAEKFGGLTAHTRAPAEGLWKDGPSGTDEDDIVIYEVMAEELDEGWWKEYR